MLEMQDLRLSSNKLVTIQHTNEWVLLAVIDEFVGD